MWERVYAKVWFSLSYSQISTVIALNPGWPAVISANDTPTDSCKKIYTEVGFFLSLRGQRQHPCDVPDLQESRCEAALHSTSQHRCGDTALIENEVLPWFPFGDFFDS